MKKLIASLVATAPLLAFAQPITEVNALSKRLTDIGNVFIQILIAFAVIWIVFNVIRFIVKADSEDRKKYQNAILWGIVGLAVILSIWGLVRILTNTFKTDTNVPTQQFPRVQYPQPVGGVQVGQ